MTDTANDAEDVFAVKIGGVVPGCHSQLRGMGFGVVENARPPTRFILTNQVRRLSRAIARRGAISTHREE